tara:strand:+ start:223 stop:621 length:399 start_codon:yes stop_codon:yes gene_type:complete
MNKFLSLLIPFLIIHSSPAALAEKPSIELAECVVITHCVREDWQTSNVNEAFKKAKELISQTPRTRIVDQNNSYLHAEAETRWIHYIDDLEIKALPEKGILQIRSESRVGIGDNGVNKKRIDNLSYRMTTNQ